MTKTELSRLEKIEQRIKQIAEDLGLRTVPIDFNIVPAQKMLEGMAYRFPINFSHWSFGRDYEKYKTIYDYMGHGSIPYEQVWNFDRPVALIVDTNPFPLKVLTMAHVFGHVDYFLSNIYLQQARKLVDIAEEAKAAAKRFKQYELHYGKEEVEKTIEAGMSIQWQQHPDVFTEEELDNDLARDRLIAIERAKLERRSGLKEFQKPPSKEERERQERYFRELRSRVPPQPIYDLLGYIIRYSEILQPWQRDVLAVIRNQARALTPNSRTVMMNEGWATYVHQRIIRRLFQEQLLSPEEYDVYITYNARVVQPSKMQFNWYYIGSALYEYIEERWNKGRFGREYEECTDPLKRAAWDTKANQGQKKILEVRAFYSNRLAIEEFFTDEFIRNMQLYIYEERQDPQSGDIIYQIVEDRPEIIRQILKNTFTLYGAQPIVLYDANFQDRREFYLKHYYYGLELEPRYRDGTLAYLYYLWGREIHIETVENGKKVVFSFDGKRHRRSEVK